MKIIDKVHQRIAEGKPFFSFEYFPPRTAEGVENLLERQERMVAHGPVFCDITWGAGGTTADVTLDIAIKMQNQICIDTMMHLTCTNIKVEQLSDALAQVKRNGIQNILALRGDPPKGQEKFEAVEGGLSCALDLVRFIRKEHGDYFGICVAGYPEAHPDTIVEDPEQMEKNYWSNIEYLKQKIEAGGELIITQLFYDVDIFFKFVKDCRSVGITVPILPGIMPIMTYGGFKRMTGFCKTRVPQDLADKIESLKDNEEALKAFGIEHGADMCKKLLAAGTPGLHLYSLNLEPTVLGILERVGFVSSGKIPRSMPWSLTPAGTKRAAEGVRPVCWAQRARSYIGRTSSCAGYPGTAADWGSWTEGSAAIAATKNSAPETLRHHTATAGRREKALKAWGESLSTGEDVTKVFASYYQGSSALLPWCEGAFKDESGTLAPRVAQMISAGMLPINVLPALNGVPSDDAAAGWGSPGGYVYQKGYVEFFVAADRVKEVLAKLETCPSIAYMASNKQGELTRSSQSAGVSTVSWGVFPGKAVVQPYVLDSDSFSAWKDEAFALWSAEWGALYEEGAGEEARKFLQSYQDSWFLVSVLEHDYVKGDVFRALGV